MKNQRFEQATKRYFEVLGGNRLDQPTTSERT